MSSSDEEVVENEAEEVTESNEADEEEEEFYEEDEEEEEEEDSNKKSKKRRKNLVENFFLDEAEDDDDDDEAEEDEAEDGYETALKEQEKAERQSSRELHGHRSLFRSMEKDDDAKKIAEYYRNRYSRKYASSQLSAGNQFSDTIMQQQLLPGVNDPNLWTVKCKIGEEKQTALLLMRKYIAYQNKSDKQPLQIKSVIVREGIKGYIYIEAFKQTHVKAAIEDVSNLRLGVWKQEMVPTKEMPDVLKVVKDSVKLKPGTWVRLKKTIYKDDLAQVESVDTAQNQVTLKLVPRIDYNHRRGHKLIDNSDEQNKMKRKTRPPQRLFDPEAISKINGNYFKDKEMPDYWIFEFNRYNHKGFLVKNFPLSAIIAEGVNPTLKELEKFEETPEGVDSQTAELLSKTALNKSHNFVPGDVVEVCSGELVHLNGVIIGIDGDKIRMMPNHEDLKSPIEFLAAELRKYFKVGDHVKVIGGRNEGETGLIVRVEENKAIIISDLTMEELTIFHRFLQLCKATATGIDSLGHFEWGDLVQIDANTMGVIVRLEKETFRVLTMNNKVLMVNQLSLIHISQGIVR